MENRITPVKIMQLGSAFWASKTLLSAIELGLFTALANQPQNAAELGDRLGLHPRSRLDFFDALVALGMLERNAGIYSNTDETDLFLDRNKPSYLGGLLEMLNSRLYGFWGHLTEALRTGQPQNEAKAGLDPFAKIYENPDVLRGFLSAMTGVSTGSAKAIAEKFPWAQYKTLVDVGTAQGAAAIQVLRAHTHLRGVGFDLAAVGPIFEEYVRSHGLADRLTFLAGDFFAQPLPGADVLLMGHILHDWDLSQKRLLLRKAYEALPPGGALIVYEALIDDDRRQNAFGLLASLNMLIETPGGFDYTGADCCAWMREVGFRETRIEQLIGPESMVVGIK